MYAFHIHEKKLKSIALFKLLKNILEWKLQLKQGFKSFKRIKKYIYIISNLFMDFLIRLTWHHSSYIHKQIHYNHEIINVIRFQNSPL